MINFYRYFESAFVDGRCCVRNAQESADSAPQFALVINAGTVTYADSGTVEKVDVETANPAVGRRYGDVPLLNIGGVIRAALTHQIRSPFIEYSTCYIQF